MSEVGKQPVFVIGAPRSGTTVFFDLFTSPSDFGFLTNYDDILAGTPFMGFVPRLLESVSAGGLGVRRDYSGRYDFSSLRPRKTEAYRFWSRYAGAGFQRSYLWKQRPSLSTACRIRNSVARCCKVQSRDMFSAKLTGPGRIGYLLDIFPNAKFVHVVRDCRPQVSSILDVGFWRIGGGLDRLWWDNDLPGFISDHLAAAEMTGDPIALAAAQWRAVVNSIRKEAHCMLGDKQYREVSYEDFVTSPARTIRPLWDWVGVAADTDAINRVRLYPVRPNANGKWRQRLSAQEENTIIRWAKGPLVDGPMSYTENASPE